MFVILLDYTTYRAVKQKYPPGTYSELDITPIDCMDIVDPNPLMQTCYYDYVDDTCRIMDSFASPNALLDQIDRMTLYVLQGNGPGNS